MNSFFPLVVAGLAAGSLYALLALGLVLVYQVSGVVNFAQGAMATAGAYITWHLTANLGMGFGPAVALTLAVTFLCGVLLQAILLVPLRRAPPAASLIVSLGLLSIIEAAIGQVWGLGTQFFILPVPFTRIALGPISLVRIDVITIGVAVLLIAAFFVFLRWTRAGLSLRAVAQTARGARLVGVRVDRVLLVAWGIGAATAAVAGILIAGRTSLNPAMGDIYLLSAFAGAIIGGLDSLPGAALGALSLGVIQNLVAFYISNEWHNAIVFVLMLVVLMVRPSGLFGPVAQRRV